MPFCTTHQHAYTKVCTYCVLDRQSLVTPEQDAADTLASLPALANDASDMSVNGVSLKDAALFFPQQVDND